MLKMRATGIKEFITLLLWQDLNLHTEKLTDGDLYYGISYH
jgi:hypothetical protein